MKGLAKAIIIKVSQPFKHQPYKLVKHTQTIRRQKPTNSLSVFDQLIGLVLKGLIFLGFWYLKFLT